MQSAIEPTLDESQVSIDGRLRRLHQRGRFLGGAAEKVAQFDKLNFMRINGIQLIQGQVELKEVFAANFYPRQVVAQRHANAPASAHLCLIPTRVIDKNSPHYFGRKNIEMPTVIISDFSLIQEFQIKFVHESCRLEQVGVSLSADVCRSDLSQMWIYQRHELLEDRVLALSPLRQKQSYFSRFRWQIFSNHRRFFMIFDFQPITLRFFAG
jgi:hypothetical protein